jgi:hypothetical protein
MTELMRHSGNFIEKRCEKCGSHIIQNLWGQRWCMSIRKCGWFDSTITNDLPLPQVEDKTKKVVKPPKKGRPKGTVKKG